MATSDTVEVAVKILDRFSDDLKELEAKLERIDGKRLNVELDIDAEDIQKIEAKLKGLEKRLNSTLDIDIEDYQRAMAIKAALARDMTSTLHINTRGFDGDLPGASGIGPPFGGHNDDDPAAEFLANIDDSIRAARKLERADLFGDVRAHDGIDMDLFAPTRDRDGRGSFRTRLGQRMRGAVSRAAVGARRAVTPSDSADFGRHPFRKMGRALRRAVPSMHTWHNLVAAIIPVIIVLAGAALGAAAALGALAAAGAAMVGIGLLGYGDSLTESLNNFKRDLKETKQEIVGILRPVGMTFQPFVAQLLDQLPGNVQKLVDPLQRLEEVGFDEFFLDALDATANWIRDLVLLASELAPQIQAIGWAIGDVFGNLVIKVLRWAVVELYNNWEAFANLAQIVGYAIVVLYNVAKAVGFAITVFKPLFALVAAISDTLGNRLVGALLATITAMVSLGYVMAWVGSLMAMLKGMAIAQAFWNAMTAVTGLWKMLGVVYATLQAIVGELIAVNLLTGGLLLAAGLVTGYAAWKALGDRKPPTGTGGGSYTPPAGLPGGATAGGTEINIYGNVGNTEYQKLKDEFPSLYAEQQTIDKETLK